MKTTARWQTPQARPAAEANRPLSPTRAFVVQFREGPQGSGNRFAGQVEHVTTGEAARFESVEDLMSFLVRVLGGEERSSRDGGT